jgi:hypothetical protein
VAPHAPWSVGWSACAINCRGSLVDVCLYGLYDMPMGTTSKGRGRYRRRSFFVDSAAIGRARRVLKVDTDAEAVRLAVERVVEMEEFWRFMSATRGRLDPGSIDPP